MLELPVLLINMCVHKHYTHVQKSSSDQVSFRSDWGLGSPDLQPY